MPLSNAQSPTLALANAAYDRLSNGENTILAAKHGLKYGKWQTPFISLPKLANRKVPLATSDGERSFVLHWSATTVSIWAAPDSNNSELLQ